jgi:hypothetical protein
MTDVSPGKPSAGTPNFLAGCTLVANPMQQRKSGATCFLRISCTYAFFLEIERFLSRFKANIEFYKK